MGILLAPAEALGGGPVHRCENVPGPLVSAWGAAACLPGDPRCTIAAGSEDSSCGSSLSLCGTHGLEPGAWMRRLQ